MFVWIDDGLGVEEVNGLELQQALKIIQQMRGKSIQEKEHVFDVMEKSLDEQYTPMPVLGGTQMVSSIKWCIH